MSSDPGGLLKTGQIADLFKVDRSTVRRWVRLGLVEAIKTPGGHIRIRREDVEQYLKKQRGE